MSRGGKHGSAPTVELLPGVAVQLLLLVAVASFAVLSGVELSFRLGEHWATKDSRYDTLVVHALRGREDLVWEFDAPGRTLGLLQVFVMPFDRKAPSDHAVEVRLTGADGRELAALRTAVAKSDFAILKSNFRFEGVEIPPGERLRFSMSLPEAGPAEGFYVASIADPFSRSSFQLGDTRIEKGDLDMIWIGRPAGFPGLHVAAGALLLTVLAVSAARRQLVARVVVLTAMTLLVGFWAYELRLHASPDDFWPDEYVPMSQQFFDFFRRESSRAELVAGLRRWRNGQVFLVPVLVGAVRLSGASAAAAYQFVVCAFTFGSLLVFLLVCRELWRQTAVEALAIDAALLSSPFFVRAAGSLQTDIGGVFFAILSIVLLARWMAGPPQDRRWTRGLPLVLALVLGALTRIQVIPLLLLPAAAGIWELAVVRRLARGSGRACLQLVSISVASAVVVLLVWSSLGLLGTFEKARAFAADPRFTGAFTWERFLLMTTVSSATALVAVAVGFRRLFVDSRFAAVAGGISALLLILALGRIVPWNRYWSPIYIPSLYLGLLFAQGRPNCRAWALLICGIAIAVGVYSTLSLGVLVRG
jgi:hypothetical protein